MRLLQLGTSGEFYLTKDLINDVPPYAILSHTWGDDNQEVTFKDLAEGSGIIKAGYRKIQLCAEQAAHHGLQYIWVDTCCIDKSNNVELSEAINSMFRWYRNATKCYVYLADVSTNDRRSINDTVHMWESTFRKSRWFTRGWTLQELIAPPSVEFFSSEGKWLGDKKSLEQQVHEITGISVQALRGRALSEFSVDERFSWADSRETTREEDGAYSLLGLFEIYMPLIYGEGKSNAFCRLREAIDKGSSSQPDNLLNSLPYAAEAPFNSYQRQHESICLGQTRVDILREIQTWASDVDERCIFWLNGLAGTGKSTIARTIARWHFEQQRLGASFFFSRGGGDVGNASKFVTSIAVQLASIVPTLHRHTCEAITERPDIANQSLRDQWHQLVLRPLLKLNGSGSHSSYIVIVDALDECDDDNNIRTILQLLAETRSLKTVRLRMFLTSRPEIPIRYGFCQIPDTERRGFVLHSISPSIVDHDISIFLDYNLKIIGRECQLGDEWPGEQDITRLVCNANGLFIWASTACRFIREGRRFAADRLSTILKGAPVNDASSDDSEIDRFSANNTTIAPDEQLNAIYVIVLRNSVRNFKKQERKRWYKLVRETVGAIVLLFSPLSVLSLAVLLRVRVEDAARTLDDLHSILNVPEDSTLPIRLHHPSFRDFLLDKKRCGDLNFWVDERQLHQILAESCISLLSDFLKQDICEVEAPGALVTNLESSRVEKHLPSEIQYACLYWIPHLRKGGTRLCDNEQVHQFLQQHLLHWLEALAWMRRVSEGIHAITSLESIALGHDHPRLSEFVHDAKRFALYNRQVIEQAPLQIYCSALVFAPVMSVVRRQFICRVSRWIRRLPEVEKDWNALLQTLEGHSDRVIAVVFSPDGKLVASASRDGTVKLWDAGSGASLQALEGHSDWVTAVAFSPDGKLLALALSDMTVKLWDAGSGASLQTLKGHSELVSAVAFSPDGKLLASVSNRMTVKLSDVGTGEALRTLKGHSDYVRAVAFSPGGKLLASVSDDMTMKIWDAGSGEALRTLKGHSDPGYAVAFSLDGKLLASAPVDTTVKLWDAGSGEALRTLKGHSSLVCAVAFSPDGKLLASASADMTLRLWDTGSGVALQALRGHSKLVSAVAFSPDGKLLVSASDDRMVKLWDTGSRAALQMLEGWSSWSPAGLLRRFATAHITDKGHSGLVSALAFSPDGKLLASVSSDRTVMLWGTGSGAALQMLEGHSDRVVAVAFSPDGKLLASASVDMTVKLWDAGSGASLQTLDGHTNRVSAVAFSPDGKLLASASADRTARLWDVSSGVVLRKLTAYSSWVDVVAFSPDGELLVLALSNRLIKLWDVGLGVALQTFEGHPTSISAMAFSPDSELLASASRDSTIKLWDTRSGAALQTLRVDASILTLSFSDDGKFIRINGGPLCAVFPSDTAAVSRPILPPSIFVRGQWVSRGTENILWLPSEYRPNCVAIHRNIVSFGYRSGRVSFMEFAF